MPRPHSDPVAVEVHTVPGHAHTIATRDWLALHGVPSTEKALSPEDRASFVRRGYTRLPVVIVWLGEGERRVRYLTWCGHKPDMLQIAQRLHEASLQEKL